MLTAQRLVERSLRQYSNRVAIVDGSDSITYATLADRTARLANALVAMGASAGRPVAALLPNEFRMIEVDVAAMRAGVTRVSIGTRLSVDECRFIIEHSGAAVLVTNQEQWERIGGRLLGDLRQVLLTGGGTTGMPVGSYEAALAQAGSSVSVPASAPDDPAYILYTSGTTGRPKGATHSHGGRVAALVNMIASEIRADQDSGMIHCAPLSHGSGSKVLTFLALGARNIVLPKFAPDLFADAVTHLGGTHSFMVPTMLQLLMDGGTPITDATRTMRQISFGGAPITDALFGRSLDAFGPILTQVYGSCEAPHPITVVAPADYQHLAAPSSMADTAGRASAGSDIAIVDDDGVPVDANVEGELWVRGAHMMTGYWRDEKATTEAFRAGGWYATGDVAVIDEQGFVRFRDRKRDLIISGGLNIYPSEVERVLADHENVREAAVVSAPNDKWGEEVVAFIVLNAAGRTSETDITDWVGRHLAGYKKPRRVFFVDDLPKGSTNKVLKRELKAPFWEGHARRIN